MPPETLSEILMETVNVNQNIILVQDNVSSVLKLFQVVSIAIAPLIVYPVIPKKIGN